jgi:hypothetical protein
MALIGDFIDVPAPASPDDAGADVFERFQADPNVLAIAVVDALWSNGTERAVPILEGMSAAARAYGVPIVGGRCLLMPDGRYRLKLDPPLRLESTGDKDADIARETQAITRADIEGIESIRTLGQIDGLPQHRTQQIGAGSAVPRGH